MSLVRAELRRLFKRRFTRWMLVFVVLVLGAIVAGIAATNQAPGPAARAQAEVEAQRQYEEQQQWMEQEIRDCERAQADGAGDELDYYPVDCEEIREWYAEPEEMVEWFLPPTFDFRNQFGGLVTALAGVLALFAFVVGASFVGAEWRSGGMMNLLLWRPRRLQVLGVKLGTFLLALLGLGAVISAGWTAVFWLVATFRGITDTMTAGAWQSFALMEVRGLTLVLVAGALGFAVASIGRHTATALGVAIAAFVVGVVGVSVVVYSAGFRFPQAWMWTTYIDAWMRKSVVLRDHSACGSFTTGNCVPPTMELTWPVSGLAMAVVVALALGVAMWHMRRRDVT